jgi:gliding motility-associated-like protein
MRSLLAGFLIFGSLVIATESTFGQIVINSSGSDADINRISTTSSTIISFNNSITINSDFADFSKATFILTGTDQNLVNGRTGSPVALGGLLVGVNGETNNGTKNITGGTWEVTGSIIFEDGIVVPQSGSNGKIVHTIASGSPGDVSVNNPQSYVNGVFYSKGTGTRFFPIGNNVGYFPAQLSSVDQGDLEVGMQVVNQDAGLTHGSEILDIFGEQFWEILDPSQTLDGPLVSLSSLGAGAFIDQTIGTVIVAGTSTGSAGVSLGGSASGDLIVGGKAIQTADRIFTLGKISSELVRVRIHNVVTPFADNANDYLQIENIEIFPENNVKLLDRWGVLVKEWNGYVNTGANPEPAYNLSDISTGNYICIVEYKDGNSVKSLSQMVTIINR